MKKEWEDFIETLEDEDLCYFITLVKEKKNSLYMNYTFIEETIEMIKDRIFDENENIKRAYGITFTKIEIYQMKMDLEDIYENSDCEDFEDIENARSEYSIDGSDDFMYLLGFDTLKFVKHFARQKKLDNQINSLLS